tara:strand:+ start:104 stop:826 length:723 start_codon:yes stop_codon:yes gene_type:complete
MDDLTFIIVFAAIFLLILIGFGFLALLLKPLDGIQKSLGSSAGLGKGGERTLQTILGPYIDANLVEEKLKMPDNPRSNVEFAYNIGKTKGSIFYVPIDNKRGGQPRKNIEDVSQKYVGKNQKDGGAFTTPFGLLAVNQEDYSKYTTSWKEFARERNVIVVRHEEILPFLEFLQWYHDMFVPLNNHSSVVNLTRRWEAHHSSSAEIADEIEKSVKKFKTHVLNRPEYLSATLPESSLDEEE